MDNTRRFYALQYTEAYKLFNTERHDECIAMLESMTYDPNLPLWFVLKVHKCLAGGVQEIPIAKEHLAFAEEAYAEIIERWPPGTAGQEKMHESLQAIRSSMDTTRVELDDLAAADDDDDDALSEAEDTEQAEGEKETLPELSSSRMDEPSQVSAQEIPLLDLAISYQLASTPEIRT